MFHHFPSTPVARIGSADELSVAGGVRAKQISYTTFLQMSSHPTMAFLLSLSLKRSVAEPWDGDKHSLYSSILGPHVLLTSASLADPLCLLWLPNSQNPLSTLFRGFIVLCYSLEFPDKIFQHGHLSVFSLFSLWTCPSISWKQPYPSEPLS